MNSSSSQTTTTQLQTQREDDQECLPAEPVEYGSTDTWGYFPETGNALLTRCRKNNYFLLAAACFQTLTCSVVIFGWPNIQPVLVKKGVFLDRCDPDDLDDDNSCEDQVKMLSLIFTVASATAYGFTLINGLVLDRFGVKVTVLYGLTLWVMGLGLLSMGSSGIIGGVDYDVSPEERAAQPASNAEAAVFFSGFAFIGATAVSLLHPMYSLGNLFPKVKNSVVTALNGFGDSSAVVFVIMRLLYFKTAMALSSIFVGYIFGPVLICSLFAVFLWPRWPFKTQLETQLEQESNIHFDSRDNSSTRKEKADTDSLWVELHEINHNLEPQQDIKSTRPENHEPLDSNSESDENNAVREEYPLLGKPFRQQVLSWRFIGAVIFTCINILKFNFFFISLNTVLKDLGDSGEAYTQAFGWISLGGVFAVFVVGTVIDKYGIVAGFWGSNFTGILLSILTLIPSLKLQVVSFFVFVVFRSFLFSVPATFISNEFGFTNLGKLIGVTFMTAGATSFLAQPLLDLGLKPEGHDFYPPGGILLALTLLQSIFPAVYTYWNREALGLEKYSAMLKWSTNRNQPANVQSSYHKFKG